ncbi:hypothetical protein [Dendronalium sp. ChiSLP03b]|uniref:hypothetical protein n=1 Tax=Dendronalium sp. ChiSLP03b TaxID=3075381 RepID=UPI003919A887
MPRKVRPITDPDGSKAAIAQERDKNARERVKARFNGVGAVTQTMTTVANGLGTVRDVAQTIGNTAKQVRRAVGGGSPIVTENSSEALQRAKDIATKYGVEVFDIEKELGGDSYAVSDSLPQLTAKEANQNKLIIQRQNNALEVRHERIKQKRKIMAVATEELRLVGDVVDYNTAGIEIGTKIVKNQISDTKFQIEQSKLEETEELLEQQVIRTQGTINLTQGVRQEWVLRVDKQQRELEALQLEIEGADQRIQRKREQIEAEMFEA